MGCSGLGDGHRGVHRWVRSRSGRWLCRLGSGCCACGHRRAGGMHSRGSGRSPQAACRATWWSVFARFSYRQRRLSVTSGFGICEVALLRWFWPPMPPCGQRRVGRRRHRCQSRRGGRVRFWVGRRLVPVSLGAFELLWAGEQANTFCCYSFRSLRVSGPCTGCSVKLWS